jgi:hypothetical protein
MELLDDKAQVEAHFGPLEIVLILLQDRCTFCAEQTVDSEIILDVGHVESRFGLFGESVSVSAR